MKIYCSHSRSFDYENEYYVPLKHSNLALEHELFLPHATEEFYNTKDALAECGAIVAEVSFPATGVGIELGRAEMLGVPIIAVHKAGTVISQSVGLIAHTVIEYSSPFDMCERILQVITALKTQQL